MNISRMKVGTRLGLGFALVILAGLAMALIGSVQLFSIKRDTALLVEDRMVKANQFGEVSVHINTMANSVRNVLLSNDDKDKQAERQRIVDARAQNNALLQQLQGSVRLPAARAQLEKIDGIRSSYNAVVDRIIALDAQGRGDEARSLLRTEARPLLRSYFAALDAAIQAQQEDMRKLAQHTEGAASSTAWLLAVIAGLAALVGAAVAWLLTRSIVRQLGGEPDYAASVAREIAAGNLAVQVQLRAGDEHSLLAAMRAMRDSLAQVVGRVRQGSESVATASSQIAQGNQDLSGRTESQASALQQTAASMEQLGSTVRHNADNARAANQLAQSASTVAVQGGGVVAEVVDTMRGINEASRKIADIIQVIDGIAFQTNILALNAAVEAARAGEQGRGFAVVAGEVRSLAQRSAEAAKEIKQLITDSVGRVEQGTQLVDRAGSTMQEVVASIRRVTDLMGEISAASGEQSQGVSQVGEAVQQMDQVTQQNAALVEEMAAAASSLSGQAQELVQAVGVFRLDSGHGRVAPAPRPAASAPLSARGAAPAAARPGAASLATPARRPAPPPAIAAQPVAAKDADDDWETF